MELDEMKTRWEELSSQLEKQQIVSRNNLENAVHQFKHSISAYLWLNIITSIAAFPLCIGIALWRGLIDLPYLWIGLAGVAVSLLFNLLKVLCFRRMERFDSNITDQALLNVRYQKLRILNVLFDYTFVTIYIGWILLSRWELFASGPVMILVSVVTLAFAGGAYAYRWEAERIKALKSAIENLREFSEE